MLEEQKVKRDRFMGQNLRRLRLAHGLSQEKICAALQLRGCDIGRTTYDKYENGHWYKRLWSYTYNRWIDPDWTLDD